MRLSSVGLCGALSIFAVFGTFAACSSGGENAGAPNGGGPLAEAGTGTGDSSPSIPACAAAQDGGPADIGFRAATNGFNFQNYTNAATDAGAIQNLGVPELRRYFGDQICGSGTGDTCTPTPPANQWLTTTNDAMNGGHCEGMAVAALLFFLNKLSPASFGSTSGSVGDLMLDGNTQLQREIAYWFATQTIAPTSGAELRTLTPNQVADTLAAAFSAGTSCETYTMGIYKPGYKEGHAITPYAVVAGSAPNQQKVMVYDNNYPGQERTIIVQRDANTWSYEAAADPNVPASQYAGDATTFTLTLTPTSSRFATPKCPFCGDATPDAGATSGARSITTSGQGDLLVTDAQGRRVGYDAQGNPVDEIPGAAETPTRGGDLWSNQHAPTLTLSEASALTLTLDGSRLSQASPSDVTMVTPGLVLAVNGIALDPMQVDTLTLSADSTEVTYTTKGMETPIVVLGVQLAGADYEFFLHSAGEASGQVIDAQMDLARGQLKIDFIGTQGASTYDVEVDRIDTNGTSVFKHSGNNLSGADTLYLQYGSWAGDGSPMTALLDQGSNGTMDQTISLSDQP